MKYRVSFFSSICVSLLCASVSYSAMATQTSKPERWFEVEVILFEQTSDKKTIKEEFPDQINASTLPQYKRYFDLLTPYLQPDITGIKQFIPLCKKHKAQSTFIDSLPKIQTPFANAINIKLNEDKLTIPDIATDYNTNTSTNIHYTKRALDLQKELTSPLFSTQNICIIEQKDIAHLYVDEEQADIQLNALNVQALPPKLNALGSHISNSPYLIAEESLLLSDITKRLKWSKEFKPLLHFGWRQVAVTRNKAIPLKLFAGKHLNYQYLQALKKHQSTHSKANFEEQTKQLNNTIQDEIEDEILEAEQKANNNAQQEQYFAKIFNELDSVDNTNINVLINELEQQKLEDLITSNQPSSSENKVSDVDTAPIKPLQPWFLDGFFKVHLDHYLYITADFNVVGKTIIKNAAQGSEEPSIKLINFSQNKRAITGEIHYFDHPYVGMLVQIRRFDPTKPIEEAVTQVVN